MSVLSVRLAVKPCYLHRLENYILVDEQKINMSNICCRKFMLKLIAGWYASKYFDCGGQ